LEDDFDPDRDPEMIVYFVYRVPTHPGKLWNLRKEFSRPVNGG